MEEELKKEIAILKKENKEIKTRLDELEKTISIIKEDLYIEYEVEDEIETGECGSCNGECGSCKNNNEEE